MPYQMNRPDPSIQSWIIVDPEFPDSALVGVRMERGPVDPTTLVNYEVYYDYPPTRDFRRLIPGEPLLRGVLYPNSKTEDCPTPRKKKED